MIQGVTAKSACTIGYCLLINYLVIANHLGLFLLKQEIAII